MSMAALALVAALTGPTPPIPLPVACTAAPGLSAAGLLARADSALGVARTDGRILHWTGMSSVAQDYQSDRTYPPFFAAFQQDDGAYDPASGALRMTGKASYLSYGTNPMPVILSSADA